MKSVQGTHNPINELGELDRMSRLEIEEFIILLCPGCKCRRESTLVGQANFGCKGDGGNWKCLSCGSQFTTGPALTVSILNGEGNHG